MRYLYSFILSGFFLLQPSLAIAVNNTAVPTVATADSAYAADDFGLAIATYEEIALSQGSSPDLLYNLGNAYYKNGMPGKAVLSYERALRIDPTHNDARFNLSFVKSRLVDRQFSSKSMFMSAYDAFSQSLKPDTWAWLGTVFFIITILLAAIYLYTNPVVYRKIGFFGALLALPLSVLFYIVAWNSSLRINAKNDAVIISPSVILSSSPRAPKDRNEEVALLHEGSQLRIIDSLTIATDSVGSSRWYKVELDSDHKGWAPASALEII